MADQVTLEAAADYGRRCESIGKERRNTADLQDAMNHPGFKTSHHALLDRLAAEYRQSEPLIERPPFATIQIGTFKKAKELHRALINGGFRVSDYAGDLMDRMTLVAEPMTIDLNRASNAELGLTQGGTVAQSFEAIAKIGGEKLPPEVGPYYRLNNPNQPMGEWELMYMDPITDRDGDPNVFIVARNEYGLWLYGLDAYPGDFYCAGVVWVFGRKRPVGA